MGPLTKRQAIAETRDCANVVIEQLERRAKGWDRGAYRDDDTVRLRTINDHIALNVDVAFELSARFQSAKEDLDYLTEIGVL